MKTSHASGSRLKAARIESAPVLPIHELIQQHVQFALEDSLQATQNKISPSCGVNKKTQVVGY